MALESPGDGGAERRGSVTTGHASSAWRKHSIRETRPEVAFHRCSAPRNSESGARLSYLWNCSGADACIASIGCRGETEERIVRVTPRVARIARFRDGYPCEGCVGLLQPDGGGMRWGALFQKRNAAPASGTAFLLEPLGLRRAPIKGVGPGLAGRGPYLVGTVAIVCRMRLAIWYGSPCEFGRRSSR